MDKSNIKTDINIRATDCSVLSTRRTSQHHFTSARKRIFHWRQAQMFHFSSPTKINVVNQALYTVEAFSQTTNGSVFHSCFL